MLHEYEYDIDDCSLASALHYGHRLTLYDCALDDDDDLIL